MTIKCCYWLADLIGLLSSLCFLKHPYFPKQPHHLHLHFLVLHFHFLVVFLCHPGYCISFCCLSIISNIFFVSLWFKHAAFLHVTCWLFLDIKNPWVSLVCPIHILFSLTSYCLQLLLAFSHSLMCV